jgi:hypothetical protein
MNDDRARACILMALMSRLPLTAAAERVDRRRSFVSRRRTPRRRWREATSCSRPGKPSGAISITRRANGSVTRALLRSSPRLGRVSAGARRQVGATSASIDFRALATPARGRRRPGQCRRQLPTAVAEATAKMPRRREVAMSVSRILRLRRQASARPEARVMSTTRFAV